MIELILEIFLSIGAVILVMVGDPLGAIYLLMWLIIMRLDDINNVRKEK